jgi:hypothetical protein
VSQERRNRRVKANAAASESFTNGLATNAHSTRPALAPHGFRLAVAQVLVLVVQTSGDQYRRRVFLSLAAAERAARRAEVKGHDAHVILCRLVPVMGPEDACGDA